MKKSPLFLIILTILILAAIIIGGVTYIKFYRQPKKEETTQKLEKVKINYGPVANNLPTMLAFEKGFFKDEGLDVELIETASGANPVITGLISGDLHAQGTLGWATIITVEAESPGTFKTYGNCFEEGEFYQNAFIVKKNSGIKSVSDFKGKKIGMYKSTTTYTWLKLILEKNGLDPEKDVNILQVDINLQTAILASGQVDVLFAHEPFITISLEDENNELLEINPKAKYVLDPAPGGPVVMFTKKFEFEHPETVEKIKRAFGKSIEEVSRNESESKKILPEYTALSEEQAAKTHLYACQIPISDDQIKNLQKFADILYDEGEIKSPVDVTTLFD